MKTYMHFMALVIAIVMAGCSDDKLVEEAGIPVETGDEIMFGSTLNGDQNVAGAQARTHYGNRNDNGIPIYWDNGDEIAIYCAQSAGSKLVNYKVTPSSTNEATSSAVVKVDPTQAGLQWGSEPEHHFYGIYPASAVKPEDQDDQQGTISAFIPANQKPLQWKQMTPDELPKPTRGADIQNADKIYFGVPNMDYSLMFAYQSVNKDKTTENQTINLNFKNLITVLDIVIPGPDQGQISVTNINVDVIATPDQKNAAICGKFDIQINDAAAHNGTPTCTSKEEFSVNNRVSIPCYYTDEQTNEMKFVTLGPKDYLVAKAFIIPDDVNKQTEFRQFKITVAYLNGAAKTITLNPTESGQSVNQVVVPHKINRILLPKLTPGAPAMWMGNLDSDIYLSELSIPGSKMSYLTKPFGGEPAFQTKTIQEQFADGVRAFIIQTGSQTTYNWSYGSGFVHNKTEMPIVGATDNLDKAVSDIVDELKKATTEYAFVMLTCHASYVKEHAYEGFHIGNVSGGPLQRWIEAVRFKLDELTQKYPENIYTNEVNANTTLGDVRGKIVFKVNYNDPNQHQYLKPDDKVPALFSLWEAPPSPYYVITTDLDWGTFNNASTRTPLHWMYQEVTNVPTEAPEQSKIDGVKEIFAKSVEHYLSAGDKHDTWYMNDLGGAYRNANNELLENSTMTLAKKFNQIGVDALQSRTQNASTGLVFMNFADRREGSGAACQSDFLLATIIDNNFKFRLRKKSTNPTAN